MSVRIGKSGPVTIGASKKYSVQQFLSDTKYSFACDHRSSGECRNKLRSYVGVLRYEDGLKITSGNRYFSYMDKLEEIPELDLSNLKSLYTGFSYDKSLKKLPNSLSNAPLSDFNSLYCAFWECRELEEIPDLNTAGNQILYYAFRNCVKLKKGPNMDTSSVTDMTLAFDGCTSLEEIPHYNTSKVTTFAFSFAGCQKLTDLSWLDFSSARSLDSMCYDCRSLKGFPTEIDCAKINSISSCIALTPLDTLPTFKNTSHLKNFSGVYWVENSGATTLPWMDTSNGTNFGSFLRTIDKVTEVPAYDMSKGTNFTLCFYGLWNVTAIHAFGFKASFSLTSCYKMGETALVEVLNNLGTLDEGKTATLTLGSTLLAKLTDDEKAIATNKGWTLA